MPTNGAAIDLEGVVRRFGAVEALGGVSVSVQPGEFFSLLGPSGCGKTTLLRIIAGLDMPDAGQLRIDGVDALCVPAHLRPVNTVFQSYALFPHMTVYENVAFGLRMKRVSKPELARRVEEVMALVEIEGLASRRPAQLSGGQKQRVALARAIVNAPRALLLDEPLGALDMKLRKQLQEDLLALQRRLGITFIYVTHDQEEALVLSDRIAVMNAGRIEQMGDAENLYEKPRTRFVGQFLGSCSVLDATVARRDSGELTVRTAVGELRVALGTDAPEASRRDRFNVAIRPEKIVLRSPQDGDGADTVRVRVDEVIYIGAETHYILSAGGQKFRAEMMNTKVGPQGFELGQEVLAHFPPAALMVLDD